MSVKERVVERAYTFGFWGLKFNPTNQQLDDYVDDSEENRVV